MNLKQTGILWVFILAMLGMAQSVSAEESATVPTDTVTINSSQPTAATSSADMQWAWGEVTNLDLAANTLTLKYLDYETDQEKELVLTVDEKTTFENIKTINELKVKDTLSVDYVIGIDNKNIAKNISYEKPDAVAPAQAAQTENSQPLTAPVETEAAVEQVEPPAQLEAPVDVAPKADATEEMTSVPVQEPAAISSETPATVPVAVEPAPTVVEPAPVSSEPAQ